MTNKTLTAGIAASAFLGGFFAVALAFVWGVVGGGLTLPMQWGWIVTPVVLAFAQAFGLALVVRAAIGLRAHCDEPEDDSSTAFAKLYALPPLISGVFLLLGWAAKAWA